MNVVVDADKCIGCTLCAAVAPEVFKMKGDKAVVCSAQVPKEAAQSCRDAAAQCPVEAISVIE